MKTKKFLILFLMLIVFSASCQKDDNVPLVTDLDQKSQTLVEADNSMGIDLFQRICQEKDENVTISPLSISLALAMTYNGAKEETKLAMQEAMHLSGLTANEINQGYKYLVDALLAADPKVTLDIAQSIWYRDDMNVIPGFIEVNKTYYDAKVSELDFSSPNALDIINGWIEDKTHDKIRDMIDEIESTHVMFLVNAIYFNGTWKTSFDETLTRKQPFTKEDGTTIDVDMMCASDSVNYQVNELFSSVELPYGDGNFNMVILLPVYGKTCNDIITEITPEKWKQWMGNFTMTYLSTLQLPKFKTEFEMKLNDILSAMGMEIAFNPRANFKGITTDTDIWIDYVQHNTFIDVNEKGTEAAAATVVAMEWRSAVNMFVANKPFVYAITEKETGAILFIGKMMEPAY
ncbi:MAG: serpin family protein [Prolixibacteraceae bacterium]|nr:serpin family protein [Prolixibacteraceae bacterium]